MAKKRRKPSNRPRNPSPPASGTRTAERPQERPADAAAPKGSRGSSGTSTRKASPEPKQNTQAAQRTRTEKKELARQQREQIRKLVARRERARRMMWGAGIAVVIAVGVLFFTRPDDTTRPETLPGELTTEAPWPANAAESAARADAIGLPAEGTVQHTHTDVQIFVHGEQQPVPVNIGITDAGVTSLHTHTEDGVVHVESSQSRDFTLGEFFDVWGVRLSPSCVGTYCNDDTNKLQVFVNGQEVTGSAREVLLDDQATIVLTYGTQDELPNPVPSSFDFGSLTP